MKTKIINKDKTKISDEEILSQKQPFEQVMNQFSMMPKLKWFAKPMVWGLAALVTVFTVSSVIFFTMNNKVQEKKKTEVAKEDTSAQKPFISRPFKEIGHSYETKVIDGNKSATVTTAHGSAIKVPANAFQFKDGKPVTGEVSVLVREFHNPLDIFLGGVPMNYDSAGTDYVFESAGMIDIRAMQGNDTVYLANGKKLDVNLKSNTSDASFNVYYLDTVKRNWIYQGKDVIASEKVLNNKVIQEPVKPESKGSVINDTYVKPRKVTRKDHVFKIKYDYNAFPELAIYKNVLFEVNPQKCTFNKSMFAVSWDKITLLHAQSEGGNYYKIILQKRDSVVNLVADAVLDSKDYEDAIKKYDEANQQNTKVTAPVASSLSATSATDDFKTMLADNKKSTRSFQVNNLGYWNCDRPFPVPGFEKVSQPMFSEYNTSQPLDIKKIYVASTQVNMLSEFGNSLLAYRKNQENICFAVTYDEKICIVNQKDFKDGVKPEKAIFKAHVYEPIAGLRELNKMIKI